MAIIIPLRPDRTAQDRSPPEPTPIPSSRHPRSATCNRPDAFCPSPDTGARKSGTLRSDNLREPRIAPYELLRLSGYRPSLAEKLGEAFGSEFGAGLYIGILAGALFTVIAAYFVAVL